jgi:uncharacterized protein
LTTTNFLNKQAAKPPVRHKSHRKRQFASLSRWLHIYLSMFSFGVLLFFAVTGFTLNHQEWFSSQQRTNQYKGNLDPKWMKTANAEGVAKLEIVEHLRRVHHITGALSDFRVEDSQVAVSFKGPGYSADAFIDRATGGYEVTENLMGLVALLNDLHKGRDTGKSWAIIIDISAILITLVSLTGLTLIFFLVKRRSSGLLVLAAGAVLCWLAYRIWVP